MQQIDDAPDLNGRAMQRGDTVTTVGGGTTGKIKNIVSDDGALFVEVRPMHRAVGKGVWHAADRLLWLSAGPASKTSKPASDPRQAGKRSTGNANAKSVKRKK